MEPENITIGLVLLIAIVAVGSLWYGEIASNYGLVADTSAFQNIQNRSIELNKLQSNMQNKIAQSAGQGGILEDMIYGANLALKIFLTAMGNIGNIFGAMIVEMGDLAGYPVLLLSIIAIIGFLFVIGIIFMIAKIVK